jgi:hypothetical protein
MLLRSPLPYRGICKSPVPQSPTASLPYVTLPNCITVFFYSALLSICQTALLSRYTPISPTIQVLCPTARLPNCAAPYCFNASLSHRLSDSLPHCTSLPNCPDPYCLSVSLSQCFSDLLPHCPTASLSKHPAIHLLNAERRDVE